MRAGSLSSTGQKWWITSAEGRLYWSPVSIIDNPVSRCCSCAPLSHCTTIPVYFKRWWHAKIPMNMQIWPWGDLALRQLFRGHVCRETCVWPGGWGQVTGQVREGGRASDTNFYQPWEHMHETKRCQQIQTVFCKAPMQLRHGAFIIRGASEDLYSSGVKLLILLLHYHLKIHYAASALIWLPIRHGAQSALPERKKNPGSSVEGKTVMQWSAQTGAAKKNKHPLTVHMQY